MEKRTPKNRPEAWIRSGLLSEPPKKPVPIDLEHARSRSVHEDSGHFTFDETRGVRVSSVADFVSDVEETLRYDAGLSDEPTYESFFVAADYWLKLAGEKEFYEIVNDAVAAKQTARTRKEKNRIDRLTFERWRVDVSIKHGFLSPTAIAANFLAASDLVHRLAKGNRQLQRAIYQYADAWHWMHFEAKGEHERAAKNVRGRAKGPEAKRETANRRKAIVEGIYERFASDEKNGSVRKNAKGAADKLFIEVNEKLYEEGIRKMTKEALTKELPRLIKQRFPKRK